MPVSAVPFISADDLGDLLGEDLSASDAAEIAVDAACDVCRNEAWQTFNQVTNDVLVLDGSGTDSLVLKEFPVNGVDSVVVGDDTLVADDDYTMNGNGTLVRLPFVPVAVWPKGRQNITVTYDHGYDDDDFPRDVRVVALRVAVRIFKQPAVAAAAGVASESLGSYSISYHNSSSSSSSAGESLLDADERRILRKYRRT